MSEQRCPECRHEPHALPGGGLCMAALCPCVADVAPIPDPTPAPAEAVAAFHIDQLARVIRNEEYPEFKAAPPPDWAVRAAHKIVEFHQGLVLEGVLAADRERYRHGWCCDYDFDNGTYRTTNECISRTRNADAVEAAALTRDHARCDGLREALAALMRKWGQHSGGCCTFDESGAVIVTPESCVCRDPERTAQRLLGMYGHPGGAALAPTVAASEAERPLTPGEVRAANDIMRALGAPIPPSPAPRPRRWSVGDLNHADSSITVERESPTRARVVWRMSPDVAEQLAMLVSDHASHDEGWRIDSEHLFEAAEEAR